ncbi:hypothetical protein CAPTEDRAFT_228919 [Capitella teleta]|uniref:Glycosyltransferase family 92 protein n=1 Tax=Capitella teleta TaxID=283909 RepID=R7VES2_CAPTE|nr:hypothetical protein CAPTEDRAFT_228919 [Capitella teleta]|eukprot:ELU17124.1 hypothetical protein CAPTEDRAFT_228919 [Capitella teleta]
MRVCWLAVRRSRATVILLLLNAALLCLIFLYTAADERFQGRDLHLQQDVPRPIVVDDFKKPVIRIPKTDPWSPGDIGHKKKFTVYQQDPKPQYCQNVHKVRPSKESTFLKVEEGSEDTFVFSAYFDPRTSPPSVRILGMSKGMDPQKKFCQVWYQGQLEIYTAEYFIVPETHDMTYAPSIHVCYLQRLMSPSAVSLVNSKCDEAAHLLSVTAPRASTPSHINFTVCVTPLNFNFDKANELVEMIEMNRLLGAQRITFYNYSSGPSVHRILDYYSEQGIVQVIPWQVPVAVDTWPPDPKVQPQIHYFAQLLALNDCLYRHMFTSNYVVFTDLDEFIIPRDLTTWNEMMTSELPCYSGTGCYLFQNCFFRRDWEDDVTALTDKSVQRLKLLTQLKMQREANIWPHFSRSKYIVKPRLIVQVGVHFVFEFIDTRDYQCEVPSNIALLHHYRLWEDDLQKMRKVPDNTTLRYKSALVSRVHNSLKANRLLPK